MFTLLQVVDGDPFHLVAAGPGDGRDSCIGEFFDSSRRFLHAKFVLRLLEAIHGAVGTIFKQRKSPPRLRMVTTNDEFRSGSRCGKSIERRKTNRNRV